MVARLLRCLPMVAAFTLAIATCANGGAFQPPAPDRNDVDASRHPWSAIGKLYNGTGGACSAVAIAEDKILTAAHCLFNQRSGRYIPPATLHVLLGYRAGRYAAHARIASYEIGSGFDPLRYAETIEADWAVLTLREPLPSRIAPLKLNRAAAPGGTKAMIAGYRQDRAHALSYDRNCEVSGDIDTGRLFLHTCRGARGYSGAPILVAGRGHEVRVAGIQIASLREHGTERMVAVSVQAILRRDRHTSGEPARELPRENSPALGPRAAVAQPRLHTAVQWLPSGSADNFDAFDAAVAAWQARLPSTDIAAPEEIPTAVADAGIPSGFARAMARR